MRSRNLGSRYDKVPFELEAFDRSKLLKLRSDLYAVPAEKGCGVRRRAALLLLLAGQCVAVNSGDLMLDRLNRFNQTMRDFTGQLRAKQFNAKEAKLLSRLWRDVENSGEWPK